MPTYTFMNVKLFREGVLGEWRYSSTDYWHRH